MDPLAAWAVVNDDGLRHLPEQTTAALDLLVWMAKGGHGPTLDDAAVVERCQLVLTEALDAEPATEVQVSTERTQLNTIDLDHLHELSRRIGVGDVQEDELEHFEGQIDLAVAELRRSRDHEEEVADTIQRLDEELTAAGLRRPSIIGYDRVIVEGVTRQVHRSVETLYEHTDIAESRRGSHFQVLTEDHVVKVSVELERMKTDADRII